MIKDEKYTEDNNKLNENQITDEVNNDLQTTLKEYEDTLGY